MAQTIYPVAPLRCIRRRYSHFFISFRFSLPYGYLLLIFSFHLLFVVDSHNKRHFVSGSVFPPLFWSLNCIPPPRWGGNENRQNSASCCCEVFSSTISRYTLHFPFCLEYFLCNVLLTFLYVLCLWCLGFTFFPDKGGRGGWNTT